MFTCTRVAADAIFRRCGGAELVLFVFSELADELLARGTGFLSIDDLVLSAEAHLISADLFTGAILISTDPFGEFLSIGTRNARLLPLWKLARFCLANEKSSLVFVGPTFSDLKDGNEE